MVVQLSTSDLKELIVAAVEEVLSQQAANTQTQSVRWIDITRAAEIYDCTPRTIRNWIRDGAPAVQIGSADRPLYRIDVQAFEAWIRNRSRSEAKKQR